MMKSLLMMMLLVLSIAVTAFSQVPPQREINGAANMPKNGKIVGKIIEAATNTPMEYANVTVYRKQDSKLVSGGISKESGSFEIGDLPYGVYYAVAAFIGFEKITIKDLKILPNSPTVDLGTIKLVASNHQLGAIDVVADRPRIEYKIDKKVINVANDINAAGGTAVTALENTPSVEVDIDGNVSLRGSTSFTVLIDGRPSVLTGSDALKQIPSSVIQNIEIITNPSVKYDPDGSAGIINIVMKKNVISGLNGVVNVNTGTGQKYGSDMTLNYKTKKYNLFLGANWNNNTDFGTNKSTRETYQQDTTFLTTSGRRNQTRGGQQIKGGFDYFLSEKTSVTLSGQIGKFDFDANGGGDLHKYFLPASVDTFSIQDNYSHRHGKYVSTDASFLSKFNESGTHKLEGTFTFRDRNSLSDATIDEYLSDANYDKSSTYISQVVTNDNGNSKDYRMKVDYTLPFESGRKFEAGIQSRMERETEDFNFTNFGVNNPLFSSGMNYKEDIHSIYSTFSGSIKSLQYMLGLRGEYTDRSIVDSKIPTPFKLNRFDVFPSTHFSYELANKNQLMASYSRRINRPDGRDLDPFPSYMSQYAIRTGNPDLKPEYTDSYELSFIRNFGKSFLSFETYFRTTNNLITREQKLVGQISYMTMDNLNHDYSTGGEIMGNIDFTKWLMVNTSFSLYDYKISGQVLGVSIDKESVNYDGRLNATVKFSPDSRMQLTGFYRGPSVSAQGDQKGMMYSNLSYRQDFMKKKLSAAISVRDLFGTARYEGTSYGDGFKSTFRWTREPRVVMLTLSYKINNYKMDREREGGDTKDESTPSFDTNN